MDLSALLNFRSPWFWIIVVGGGALIAFFVLPKLRGGSLGTPSTVSNGAVQSGTAQQPSTVYVVDETQYTPPGGIQGAVPPTGNQGTPVPLTPSPGVGPGNCPPGTHWGPNGVDFSCVPDTIPDTPGGPGGSFVYNPPPSTGTTGTTGSTGGVGTPPTPPTPPAPPPSQTPPTPPKQFVYPSAWPTPTSTLSGIAQRYGVALSALEAFPENQYINQRSSQGWNLIYTTDRIRVS